MCGIFGVAFTDEADKDIDQMYARLNALIDINGARGNDQLTLTYIRQVNGDDVIHTDIFSKDIDGVDMVQNPPIFIDENTRFVLGHLRSATARTEKTLSEVHPFEYKGTYLAHNGVLAPNTVAFLEKRFQTEGHTDSWYLLRAIVEDNLDSTIVLDGTFAAWMFRNTLHINDVKVFTNSNTVYYGENSGIRYFSSANPSGCTGLKVGDILSFPSNQVVNTFKVRPMYFTDF